MNTAYTPGFQDDEAEIAELFRHTFAASANDVEAEAVTELVQHLMSDTPQEDVFVWKAHEADKIIGSAFFSRLRFDADDRSIFIMSPVAVMTDRQKAGVGQQLIRHALADLRQRGIDFVLTYGDPAFYGKTGFTQITEGQRTPPAEHAHWVAWSAIVGTSGFSAGRALALCRGVGQT
jgi:putative acetyltransferase